MNGFVRQQFGMIATATKAVETANNTIKKAVCILLGYFDDGTADFNNFHKENAPSVILPASVEGVDNTDTYNQDDGEVPLLDKENYGILKFTEKEILQMPKQFRKTLRANGCTAHVRKRTGGRYKCSYEIYYAKKPYNNPPIWASGTTLEIAKIRFIEKLNNYQTTDEINIVIPKDFDGFAIYWFDNFHKAKVIEKTFSNNLKLYYRHIKKHLERYKVKDITPAILKNLLANLPGNGKTEDDVHSILNQIFETALTHSLIKVNPVKLISHIEHERISGIELSIEEELKLLNAYAGSVYEIIYSIILYTGLRVNEYKTARIDGDFIVAINSKQKNGKIEYKKIPICPLLRERLNGLTKLPLRNEVAIRQNFNKILPNHTVKDLRKTFNTRCIKFKVDIFARKKYMGHSVGKLDKAYSGSLEDFLLEEGKKLELWSYLYPKNTQKN